MPRNSNAKILKKIALFSYFLLTTTNNYASFIDEQLQYSRVREAYKLKSNLIQQKLDSLNINSNAFDILMKAYKYEQELLIYTKNRKDSVWIIYDTIQICASSGQLGPKVMEGDLQVPEGYYTLNHFNPYSNFLLSLGVSYPNKADIVKRPAKRKGGAIYVHGNCVTIGCIPITDDIIQELYILSVMAKSRGQSTIGIHIFPFHLNSWNLKMACEKMPEHSEFWQNLDEVESTFDSSRIQKKVLINELGNYYLKK